jgi:ADP-L-glycero-D-manno-heptose 6-epimerase
MIVITGAAGFIASCLLRQLNEDGFDNLIAVDDFSRTDKKPNLEKKKIQQFIHRNEFMDWLTKNHADVTIVIHLGARTDTTEFNKSIFDELNLTYSKAVWESCTRFNIPLIYASSAATYGMGGQGYKDDHALIEKLKPLNAYGESKNEFDKWVLKQTQTPPFWVGLKFFNVYGPNEYHKGRMASVVLHAFNQIQSRGNVKLFKSHNPKFEDGKQLRDFIYVKDVVDVILFFIKNQQHPGIYNVGTGMARSFLDLANAIFKSLDRKRDIEFIDTPIDIRDKYQYFTEADITKLRETGYTKAFTSLEKGINEYVLQYLVSKTNY